MISLCVYWAFHVEGKKLKSKWGKNIDDDGEADNGGKINDVQEHSCQ